MKKISAILFFILSICGFAFAQDSFPELEIAKEIKLLRSTRSDVKIIMSEFDRDNEDDEEREDYNQKFRSEKAVVRVSYSTGDCSEDAGIQNYPKWNVPKMTATKIVITFDETTKLKNLGLKLSDFKKKLENEENEDTEDHVYYNEKAGIIILTDEGEVEKIILHPPKKQIGNLCDNENNSEILSRKTSLVDSIVESDTYCILKNLPSNVANLDLRTNGIFGCRDEKCSDAKKEISVRTTAIDPENDVLTYQYTVTGGKIIGTGWEVIWDLTDVQPGIYGITVGSDDGCGICGETKSQKILVKENSYGIVPPAKIKELILDRTELIAGCPIGRLKRIICPSGSCGVSITSVATEGKNLTYKYKTSGGKIIGSSDHVIWDLADLPSGEYSITVAASDDGTVFGTPETATVEIKENPYCSATQK
jgi:hypothetical protein